MNRFYVEEIKEKMTLNGDNHRHLAYSLRLRVGEDIVLFCGDGFEYRYQITEIKKQETTIALREKITKNIEARIETHAFISLIKQDKLSVIFQKLTELGVNEFKPMITDFSNSAKREFNQERYSRICIEACKQCGRNVVPTVNAPLSFEEARAELKAYDLVVFAYENATISIKECLRQNKNALKIAFLIGAEGGFSQNEVDSLVSEGFTPLSLGNRILRAETAAITTLSAILYELDL